MLDTLLARALVDSENRTDTGRVARTGDLVSRTLQGFLDHDSDQSLAETSASVSHLAAALQSDTKALDHLTE
ncbi:hypothetical protein, partial [Nocardia cyriacigeorgica]|uniref:hypothetical protein n=1 Tax=Nocardia cyriacigeorgica TaxID=135487 RepID=UPI00189563CB